MAMVRTRNFRLAVKNDIKEIHQLFRSVVDKMKKEGKKNWNDKYPSESVIKKDISYFRLFKYIEDRKIIGVASMMMRQPDVYKSVNWNAEDDGSLMVKRLAIHPEHEGKGIGKSIMENLEGIAKNKEYTSIRLDVYEHNADVIQFYKSIGYSETGKVKLEEDLDNFITMDKLL